MPLSEERAALDARAMRTWRAFLVAHSSVQRRMEADLEAAHQLPLAWYDVLVQLAESPERALRMSELAARVLLSRSGLTRLVDRLEREGLVQRQACQDDARGTLAVLTEAGLERLRAAAPVHLAGIAGYVTDRFTPSEIEILGVLLERIVPDGSPHARLLPRSAPPAENGSAAAEGCGAEQANGSAAAEGCGAEQAAAEGCGAEQAAEGRGAEQAASATA